MTTPTKGHVIDGRTANIPPDADVVIVVGEAGPVKYRREGGPTRPADDVARALDNMVWLIRNGYLPGTDALRKAMNDAESALARFDSPVGAPIS